ncbi:MAG: ATP-grasp domain-containing protein [Planctomycetes bacterium]|nr:ATP-grasp domain-containing protein [Planctomycetota bacterium]
MPNVVFAVPFAMDASLRFVRAAAALPGVRLAVVTQEPAERFPEDLRAKLVGHYRVRDAMQADELVAGARHLAGVLGGRIDRFIGILEPLQVPLAEARERLGLPGASVEVAKNFRDKARMKTILRANGLPCAKHQLATDAAQAVQFAERVGYPLVVKPPAGAGARNTSRVNSRAELDAALRSMPPHRDAPVLFEEFIQGEEYSFDSVTLGGRHVFHSISSYSPAPLDVLQNPWIQWAVYLPRRIDDPKFAPIFAAGPRALDALGIETGLTHMEWFRRPDGTIAISEVAARPPGAQFTTLLSYAHDFDFYGGWARLVIFDEFTPPERQYSAGAAYVRAQGSGGRIVAIRGLEEAQRELGEIVVEAKLPRTGQAPTGTYEGEGYVIVRHPETQVVERALQRLVETIRVDLG